MSRYDFADPWWKTDPDRVAEMTARERYMDDSEQFGYSGLPSDDFDEEPDEPEQTLFCHDCPPDECTGHCMSCYYR